MSPTFVFDQGCLVFNYIFFVVVESCCAQLDSYPSLFVRPSPLSLILLQWRTEWLFYHISIIPGCVLGGALSGSEACSQREGGIVVDRPVQMLNDSDTKRGPPHRARHGCFALRICQTEMPGPKSHLDCFLTKTYCQSCHFTVILHDQWFVFMTANKSRI